MEGRKLFQMKEENENISFNSYYTNIKTTSLFLLVFLQIFFLLILIFLCLYFVRQTEQYLVSHLLVYPEAGIENCSVKQLFGKI